MEKKHSIHPSFRELNQICKMINKMLEKEEENEKALKTFIKVEALYYIVVFIFSFLGISL